MKRVILEKKKFWNLKMNKIKIAILGLGVVGSHVVKLLEKNSYILDDTKCEIVAIGAKNKKKKRIIKISKYKWVGDYKSLIQFKPDLIIETIGGTGKYINDLYKFCLLYTSDAADE